MVLSHILQTNSPVWAEQDAASVGVRFVHGVFRSGRNRGFKIVQELETPVKHVYVTAVRILLPLR